MSHPSVNVIVHLSGDIGAAEPTGIAHAIAAQPGVSRAAPSARSQRLILVDYDPDSISAQRILGSVRDRGVVAQLVGL
ncbi:MAG: hypothetical protein ACM3ST_13355 [Bdellovibrio bacteriovorus]